jgi:hypothetical protein
MLGKSFRHLFALFCKRNKFLCLAHDAGLQIRFSGFGSKTFQPGSEFHLRNWQIMGLFAPEFQAGHHVYSK